MEELLEEIDCAISQDKLGFSRIDKATCLLLIDSVVNKFSFDANKVYLWEEENRNKTTIDYGDDWESIFNDLMKDLGENIFLVVTDDAPNPWPVYKGSKIELIGLLKNQRYFEYFVFDESMNKVVFDNHHNAFVIFD